MSGNTGSGFPNTTRAWKLKQYPHGEVKPLSDFELVEGLPLLDADGKNDGKVLLKVVWLSNDPAQRTWIVDKPANEHYFPPVQPGNTMASAGVGRVVHSFAPGYSVGDNVYGYFGWTEYAVIDTNAPQAFPIQKLDTDPAEYLSLGLTATTAYCGLLGTAKATAKDKLVVVSTAAGATGSVVVQIAKKVLGVKNVWGIAGGKEKCDLVTSEQIGADRAFDYKEPGWEQAFYEAARDAGFVDVYFDNTGGPITDAVMRGMGMFSRMALCGAISTYQLDDGEGCGISADSWRSIVFKKLRVEGFIVNQSFDDEYRKNAQKELLQWAKEKKIQPLKTVWETGFDEIPRGMEMLMKGQNVGKLVTKIRD